MYFLSLRSRRRPLDRSMHDAQDTYSFMKVRVGVLREYLDCMLVEGRVDDAREKFPEMEDDTFDQIVANQPAGSNNKFLMWSCKQVDEGYSIEVVVRAIRLFDGNQQRLKQKDINQYKEPGEIENAIAELGKSKSQQKAEIRADVEKIYEDEQFLVLRPHTAEASCKYGTGTKWCIAATNGHNYYSQYSEGNNKFYFVIDKTLPSTNAASKFAIAYISDSRIQVYDAPDRLVNIQKVAEHVGEKWPAIWEKIQAHVKANPLTREVEDAQKATEEHVKALLSGQKVTAKALTKIAAEAKLTMPVVKAIINQFKDVEGPATNIYSDPRISVGSALAGRADQMDAGCVKLVIKFLLDIKPAAAGGYWSGDYYIKSLISNGNLSNEELAELVKSGDEEVIFSVVKNPNASKELLHDIIPVIERFRNTNVKRDTFSALALSNSLTAEQFRNAVQDTTIDGFLHRLFYNPAHVKLSDELIKMIPVKTAYELENILKFPNISPETAAEKINVGWKLLSTKKAYDILRTTPIPPSMIEQMWNEKGQDVRTALLQNPSIGASVLKKFASSKNSAYRFAVAHNTSASEEDLNKLAKDESVSTRGAVGANPKTPQATLLALAGDTATAVRASVASNPSTPTKALEALRKDVDDFVRKSARKTIKSLTTTESIVRAIGSMTFLMKEELSDDDEMNDVMTPDWSQLPRVTVPMFIAIFLLQNNGSATREEIDAAWKSMPSRSRPGKTYGRHYYYSENDTVWKALSRYERDQGSNMTTSSRAISSSGNGWFWSPPGINKGSVLRLTPTGAAAAMDALKTIRTEQSPIDGGTWRTRAASPVKTSTPPRGLSDDEPETRASTPRGPKTTYKIYGKFKGHPAATRLKGQAYVAPANTQFRSGDQAVLTPGEGGKLKVKRPDGDHTQDWDPIDG